MANNSTLWAFVFAVTFGFACSSSDDGGTQNAVGDQMSELGDLGDRFISENQETYDTLADASQLIGAAVEGGVAVASVGPKQSGCLPAGLAGQTLLIDVQSSVFTPTDPRGPSDAVQFVLLSDPQTEVGFVNVSCTGVLPNVSTVIISVNTSDGEVLSLTASNIGVFPPSNFSALLTGTLRSSSGESLSFGAFGFEAGSAIYRDEFSRSGSTAFLVGDTITATVSHNVVTDPSFASEDIRMVVQDAPDFATDVICPSNFLYDGTMRGTSGNLSGGAFFCARPPLADGYNYFINCFDGSIDDMVVSPATVACMANLFEGDPTQVSGSVLQDIQDGTDALLGMHNTVQSVAEAGAAVALQVAAAQQQL